ncbi:cytochrome c oxidase copper chaperone isoform X1 [Amborella trichopoda]|uniref:cytochrome c oxidase copper chaperone isoform X1 n=1 Tax=Amborella trichopoda TaxID=13333 RepID=UPI0005D37C1B|nr:cytochrome c oxidase copper chaperone isoform X1 [Amborella trichopoda]|eukprot:XP_006878611.2 cytochrome c oxidase copper chaperone isoform X1 [Amborella trichopoda]
MPLRPKSEASHSMILNAVGLGSVKQGFMGNVTVSRSEAMAVTNSDPRKITEKQPLMTQTLSSVEPKPKAEEPSKRKKICCACPDTKRLRDECIVEHGEAACSKWIEAHLQCLRAEGFNV